MKNLSDNDIIESIKKGNVSDFSLLVDRYKDRTFSLLKRMLKNEMDAEEVMQDSFLKVYKSLSSFRGDSKFSTWLYKISYNSALTFLSSKKRKEEQDFISIDENFDLVKLDNEIYSTTENVNQYILKLIDKLPIKNAIVLILFYVDGFSINEISNVMGISLVNTKVLLHRSRIALKDLLLKHNYHKEIL
ncbi:MAG: RNA polymerase sigma factor [Melioribacteraceae bacterium]|nr:RNA polymerase sigma factor [Melioribacteraceae bacterium]